MKKAEENRIREDERKSIVRHLHDVLSNELLYFQYLFLKTESRLSPQLFSKLSNQLDFLRNQVRSLSYKISEPKTLPSCSIINNTKELLIDYTYLFPDIEFNLIVFPKKQEVIVSQFIRAELLLILKEIIHNAIEHGKASKIEVNITNFDTYLSLIVTDNGVGFETSVIYEGVGIKNLKQRIEDMKGLFIIDSQPLRGATLTLEIPI